MNNWNIPDWLEREVNDRDRSCIYCRVEFGSSKETRKSIATWEHIVNDARIINRENIARCCFSCNSSKGTKKLSEWLESDYCKKHGITKDTVAEVARRALAEEKGRKKKKKVPGTKKGPGKRRSVGTKERNKNES